MQCNLEISINRYCVRFARQQIDFEHNTKQLYGLVGRRVNKKKQTPHQFVKIMFSFSSCGVCTKVLSKNDENLEQIKKNLLIHFYFSIFALDIFAAWNCLQVGNICYCCKQFTPGNIDFSVTSEFPNLFVVEKIFIKQFPIYFAPIFVEFAHFSAEFSDIFFILYNFRFSMLIAAIFSLHLSPRCNGRIVSFAWNETRFISRRFLCTLSQGNGVENFV